MTIGLDLARYIDYVIALEAERLLRDFERLKPGLPPAARIEFQQPQDAEIDVSVLIPVWNPDQRHFDRCLDCLVKQNWGGIRAEVIVSDNASDSDVVIRCLESRQLPAMRYLRQAENVGCTRNMNQCISAARGRWMHILSHDDWVAPDFYTTLLRGPAEQTDSRLRYCRARIVDDVNQHERLMFEEAKAPGILTDFLDRQCVSQRVQIVSAVFGRSVVEKVGGFDLDLASVTDWEFWARLATATPVYFHPKVQASYFIHLGSGTHAVEGSLQNARAFQQFRRLAHSLLALQPEEKRRAAAAGYCRNMLERMLTIGLANRELARPLESRKVGEAFLFACKDAGLLGDVEKIIFGIS